MSRKKVRLAYISRGSIRRATFTKRKKGLLKKLSELTTLCGARICALIFGESKCPVIWPSDAREVQRTIDDLNGLPENERAKRTTNEEGFLRQQIDKLREQLDKLRKANWEEELKQKLVDAMTNREILYEARREEVVAMKSMVEAKSAMVRAMRDSFRPERLPVQPPPPLLPPPPPLLLPPPPPLLLPPPPPLLLPPPPSLPVVDHLYGLQSFNHIFNFHGSYPSKHPFNNHSTIYRDS